MFEGGQIFIADGMLILEVKEILNDKCVMTEVQNLATIGSRKNCNLPGAIIDLPAVSEKDRSDLLFGVEQEVCLGYVWSTIFLNAYHSAFSKAWTFSLEHHYKYPGQIF